MVAQCWRENTHSESEINLYSGHRRPQNGHEMSSKVSLIRCALLFISVFPFYSLTCQIFMVNINAVPSRPPWVRKIKVVENQVRSLEQLETLAALQLNHCINKKKLKNTGTQ